MTWDIIYASSTPIECEGLAATKDIDMSNFTVSRSGKRGFLLGTTASVALGIVALAWCAVTEPGFVAPANAANAANAAKGPKQGQAAPDFSLPAEDGKNVKLSDFKGKEVVLFFYDKDNNPATKQQHKLLKKDYAKYKLKGADVLGIGPDPVASHKAMHTELDLKFHLLTDKDDKVRKLYQLSDGKGGCAVLVGKDGLVRDVVGGIGELSEKDIANIYNYDAANGPKNGQLAPDFSLPAENGKNVKLSDFRGKTVVVFFYDKDNDPVTREEHKRIEKDYAKYKLQGADVLGIGPDPESSHKAMHTELDLQFHLLTDKDDKVRQLYHLTAQKGRYAVLVDKNGLVRKVAGGIGGLSDNDIFNIFDYVSGMPGSGF